MIQVCAKGSLTERFVRKRLLKKKKRKNVKTAQRSGQRRLSTVVSFHWSAGFQRISCDHCFVYVCVCVTCALFMLSSKFYSLRFPSGPPGSISCWAVSILHLLSAIYCSRPTENSITRSYVEWKLGQHFAGGQNLKIKITRHTSADTSHRITLTMPCCAEFVEF